MMCKITAYLMSLLFVLASGSVLAHTTGSICCFQDDDTMNYINYHRMFRGVDLTEQQRQQMRDLIQIKRHSLFLNDLDDVQIVHQLVTADVFDEEAMRKQAQKMALEGVNRQVTIAKIHHQMYNLLTSEQKHRFNQHQQQLISHWKRQMADK